MQNITCEIINGVSKSGREYSCLEFSIHTSKGNLRVRSYPTEIELNVIKETLNPMSGIYSNDNSNNL